MEGATQCFFSSNAAGLAVAAFVFFVTLFLVSKQWIGVSITVLLLLFSLVSGLIIVNQDLFRNALSGNPSNHNSDTDIKIANFHEQVLKSYDNLKGELEVQKVKLQTLSEEVQDLKKKQNEPKS